MESRYLEGLLPGDLYATSPRDPLGKVATGFLSAETLHWGLIVRPFLEGEHPDYEIMEALLTKGTSVGLFNNIYLDIPLRIYRVKGVATPDIEVLERVAYDYGRATYGYTAVPGIVTWWVFFHMWRLTHFKPPALDTDSVVCTVFVTMVWRDLGVDLVPEEVYPTPNMLEKSEGLECVHAEY